MFCVCKRNVSLKHFFYPYKKCLIGKKLIIIIFRDCEVKTLYADTLQNSKILYNISLFDRKKMLIIIFEVCTVKTIYTDTLHNIKILNNVSSICTNVPVYLEFEFITTEKFSIMSNYLGTNTVVVKWVDCIY